MIWNKRSNRKGTNVTKEELYNLYLEWAGDNPVLSYNDLFGFPITNIDVYEDEKIVINHMYYLIVRAEPNDSKHFLFYEANTFAKDVNGDLSLCRTLFFLPDR